jgi:4,5-DOPA dioxygenase extradiol
VLYVSSESWEQMITRRALLVGGAAAAIARRTAAQAARTPTLYVSHGAPLFMPKQEARRAALAAWGVELARPRAIVVMTPHFASRTLGLGNTGAGYAWYDLPNGIKRLLPQDLEYPSPPSAQLATRVDAILGSALPRDNTRRGLDHTTWMPLKCLFPAADVPVLELTYPYLPEAQTFAFGQKLAALRDEGVLFVASGGMTHNLALDFDAPLAQFAADFDNWAAESLRAGNVDALIDFRHKAPAANLAHPDDGAHFRVLLVALGVALGKGGSLSASFPVTGFEGSLSNRCVQLA